jgi:hypothetical protein
MKTIPSLRRHRYLKRVGILLIAAALVAGILSCEPGETYELTMAANPTDGGTATDETGTGPYSALEVVDIKAVPDDCHQFVNWEAPVGIIGNSTAAETTFIMPAQDVTVTANFEPIPPNHYKFYEVYWKTAPYVGTEVLLEDQFGTFAVNVTYAVTFGNPVEKEHDGITPISDENRHYTLYELDYNMDVDSVTRSVEVYNQFQKNVELTVWGPVALAVPTQKENHEMVECLNHYLVYVVDEGDYYEFEPVEGVNLKDQFILDGEDVTVKGPYLFANPVKKTVVGGAVSAIEDADLHWVLYDIREEVPSIEEEIQIDNQFGNQTLDLTYRDVLAVPSQKNVPPTPPLDHFKCYETLQEEPLGLAIDVWDQFHEYYLDTMVMDPIMFCNPVDKVHGTVTTSSNPDNHLTVYYLHPETLTDWWTVTVDNQFNDPAVPQSLKVWGPVALAVPTQKVEPGDHGMPKYLDHYLLYEVVEGLNVTATVDLDDQFPGTAPGVKVTEPVYFANPAVKGYVDYVGMWDPEEHLLFYRISDNEEFYGDDVGIRNQFCPEEPCYVDLVPIDQLLAVPSTKIDWAPWEPM